MSNITPFTADTPMSLYIDDAGRIRRLSPTAAGIKSPLTHPTAAGIKSPVIAPIAVHATTPVYVDQYEGIISDLKKNAGRKPKMTVLMHKRTGETVRIVGRHGLWRGSSTGNCANHKFARIPPVPVFPLQGEVSIYSHPSTVTSKTLTGPKTILVTTSVRDPARYDPTEDDHHLKQLWLTLREPAPVDQQ